MARARSIYPVFVEFKTAYNPTAGQKQQIDIILKKDIDPKTLPYADVYTQAVLEGVGLERKAVGVKRFNDCRLLLRGDDRSPDEIFEAGGFHPQYTNPLSSPKKGKDILDVNQHRFFPEGSGLVSCTSSLGTAGHFADTSGYVYLVKATGAIGPCALNRELEYSVPGGVDAEDIVAYRKKGSKYSFCGSSIFINKSFMNRYPDQVNDVIQAFLQKNECCVDASLQATDETDAENQSNTGSEYYSFFPKVEIEVESDSDSDSEENHANVDTEGLKNTFDTDEVFKGPLIINILGKKK